MQTSECSYCGILTFSDKSICETCDFAVSVAQNLDDDGASETSNLQAVSVNDYGVQSPATTEKSETAFQQSPDNFQPPRTYRTPRQSAPRSSCVICHRQIPAGQKVCFECSNKKLPVKKFSTVFAVFAILALAGIGAYAYKVYVQNSPTAVLKKYALATGSDKMGNIENLISKGKVDINVTVSPPNKTLARSINEIYSFELILQNPNKSYMVFFKTDPADPSKKEIVYKQAFDGFNGWKYSKMFNQQATLEDSTGDSNQTRPEIFLDNYESVEYLTDAMKAEYGEANLEPLMSISNYSIDGNATISKSRVAIQVVKNNQKTLLIFDKESSLLLGIFRKETIKKMPTVSNMYVDNYKTVTIKGKNSEDITVLMPTRWKFEMQEENEEIVKGVVNPIDMGTPKMSMSMTIDTNSTESGSPAEDKLFYKPISIYTAEKSGF